ncbi:MAG: substrate-binding domain-containing protein, partial [Candidatus Bipolaricaulaceae bacterium]
DITNPFFATLVRGAEDAAREAAYTLLICNTGEDLESEKVSLRLLSQKRVDGMLLAPTGKSDHIIRGLLGQGMRIVFVDRILPDVAAPAVLSENESGAYQATAHLLKQGHRRIGIVLGLPDVSTTRERLQGYRRALGDWGLQPDPGLIVYGQSKVRESWAASRELLTRDSPPTAVFATNNLMTIGAMRALRELGLRCPDDVSVVGFDDFEWAGAFDPPLTTVAQQPYEIGRQAARVLLALVGGSGAENREFRLDTHLQIRGSVACLGRSARHGSQTSPRLGTPGEQGG